MNLDPQRFERTILDLERKRFGITNTYDVYQEEPKKVENSAKKYGKGPVKKARYKDPAKDQLNFKSLARNTLDHNMNFSRDSPSRGSNHSSNRSFDRYSTNLCYDKRFSGTGRRNPDTGVNKYHTSSTPNLSTFKNQNRRDSEYYKLADDSDDINNRVPDFDIEKKLRDLNSSHDVARNQRKIRFTDSVVEDHKMFRDKLYQDNTVETKIKRAFLTPRKSDETTELESAGTKLEPYKASPRRDSPARESSKKDSNETFNITITENNDGLNSYIRKFLFKELDKIRHDCRQSNSLLSQNIASNEEFYSKKFEEVKDKLKHEVVTPQDVQALVNKAVAQKLSEMNINSTQTNVESVTNVQAQINSVVKHYHENSDDIKDLKFQVDNLKKQLESLLRSNDNERRALAHRLDTMDKALIDVREDCIANSDSFMVSVESRLDYLEHQSKTQGTNKIDVKKTPMSRGALPSEHVVNNLRSDIDKALKKLHSRVNEVEIKNSNDVKELDNQIKSVKLTGKRDIKELFERIHEVGDQIDTTDMTINKKFNILQTTPGPAAKQPMTNNGKAIENRVTRLETIAVRHGKLLDDLTANVNHLLTNQSNIKSTNHCVCEGYTEDFANKLKSSFESRIKALENAMLDSDEMEFREQVFKEIDGIKFAAIQDIKALESKVRNFSQTVSKPASCCTQGVCTNCPQCDLQRSDRNGHRSRSLKRVTFSGQKEPKGKPAIDTDSDLERDGGMEEQKSGAKRSQKLLSAGSNSIVYINSQKSIDARPQRDNVSNISGRNSERSTPRSTYRKKVSPNLTPSRDPDCCLCRNGDHEYSCDCRSNYRMTEPITEMVVRDLKSSHPNDRQMLINQRMAAYEDSPQRANKSNRIAPLKRSAEKIKYSYDKSAI